MQFCRLSKKARVLTAKLEMKRDTFLYLTCLHLDHRLERFRLKEIESIRQNLDQVFKANHCQIWTGDFNALTKEDYDTKQWYKKINKIVFFGIFYQIDENAKIIFFRQKITDVRQRNLWEPPQTDLTSKVKNDFDFQDAWALAGRPGTSKTCRFDTHIDYIFCNATWLSKYSVDKVEHVEDTASDHNMVIATFKTL